MTHNLQRVHRSRWEHEAISRLHNEGVRFPQIPYLRSLYDGARQAAGHEPTGSKEAKDKAFHKWVSSVVERGYLANVRRDLYANHTLYDLPTAVEAAHLLRPSAVVSLLSVLSPPGLTNNPSGEVFAIIASDSSDGTRPRQVSLPFRAKGADQDASWKFWFIAMNRRLYDAGREEDRMDAGVTYPCATLERAFCDLIVVNADRKTPFKTLLRAEADLSILDQDRVGRLVEAMGIQDLYKAFLDDSPAEEPEQVSRWGI